MNKITANELKTRGVKILEEQNINNAPGEVFLSVRGVTKYAILPIEYFNKLREYEIAIALKESLIDLKNGKYVDESVARHIKRISK